jgi:hypothetical protein
MFPLVVLDVFYPPTLVNISVQVMMLMLTLLFLHAIIARASQSRHKRRLEAG